MKILYVLKQDPDNTLSSMIDLQKKDNEVTIVDLRKETDYDSIIDTIASSDKIISW